MNRKYVNRTNGAKVFGRRSFLRMTSAAVVLGRNAGSLVSMPNKESYPPARAVTREPKNHFFGYYDKCPWDRTDRFMLAMEIDFYDRQPEPGEALTVGMVDLTDGNKYIPFDKTLAWSWQQGTMLQWLCNAPDREVIYNSVDKSKYISIIRDVHNGKTRILPRPIYAISLDGKQAVTLDYERVNRLRPGYGYMSLPDKTRDDPAPKEAGIYLMNLKTGDNKRILDLAWAAGYRRDQRFDDAHHWFNHLQFNPSATRFLFLHRWSKLKSTLPPGPPTYSGRWTRLYTANPDGSDVRLLSDVGMVSHFDWRDDRTILAWTSTKEKGLHFYLIDEVTGEHNVVGDGVLTKDGHCSYSPDRKWILDDTYPDSEHKQTLMLFRVTDNKRFDIGRFYQPPAIHYKPYRCDLHPRWNRDGTKVCIDSTHEGSRQMYVIDVSGYTKA